MGKSIFDPYRIDRLLAKSWPEPDNLSDAIEIFERELAAFIGRKHCRLTAGGGAALKIALKALKPARVALTDVTHPSLLEAVKYAEAEPVFLDINIKTLNISEEALMKVAGSFDMLLNVHMFGNPSIPDPVKRFPKKCLPSVVEDASQILGGDYKGKKYGSFGRIGIFSLSPYKPLSAPWAKAGAITWDDPALTKKILGGLGSFAKPDGRTASYLSLKLRNLPTVRSGLKKINRLYRRGLSGVGGLTIPPVSETSQEFPILTNRREELKRRLLKVKIPLERIYPPLHGKDRDAEFPGASRYFMEALHLPVYPSMTESECSYIINVVKNFFKS